MAASNGRKTSSSNKKTTLSTAKSTGKPRTSAQKKKAEAQLRAQDSALFHEIGLIVLFAVMALLFCCNFGLIGPAGNTVSGVLFGIFGLTAYVAPLLLFLAAAFWFANEGNPNALRKLIAGIVLFVMLGILCDLFTGQEDTEAGYQALLLYEGCRDNRAGGGILGGSIGFFLRNYLGVIGAVLVVLVCSVVCLILLTEKSLIDSLKQGGSRVRELSREDSERRRENAERRRESIERRKEDAERRREQNRIKRQEQDEERARREEARRLREEEIENEKILRMEKKVSGVMLDATLPKPEKIVPKDDMHEIILPEEEIAEESLQQSRVEIIEEQIVDVEEPVIDEKPMIKEERLSNAADQERKQKSVQEMSPAFEQWNMPDLPIRIHKEGVEVAEVTSGAASVPLDEPGLHTPAGETGMREAGFAMPENMGAYEPTSTIPESVDLNKPEFTIPEEIGLNEVNAAMSDNAGVYEQSAAMSDNAGVYGQSATMFDSAGTYGQSAAMSDDAGAYGQSAAMFDSAGTYGQSAAMSDDAGAYGQSAAMSDRAGVHGQSTVLPDSAGAYKQGIEEQEDVGLPGQESFMAESTRNPISQTSGTMNSAAGSNTVQNHPMPTSGVASAGGTSKPTAIVRPAVPQTGKVGDNRMQMEGMPSQGGLQSVTGSGKEVSVPKQYMFPPISLLQKGVTMTGDSVRELKETAMHLQQTLSTFGVKVTITDISQGPSVTRYELQPEQGVKVSKIVSLTDDIKLNLAAMDIRIEAPIPGKAAIGIEVPNKESIPVALRDLLETEEFRNFPSNLAFAVGKDIAGKVIVADIAKMPHMLIAGATGSGKSVCINTLIMGLLYKAHPDDVKLIMVDPKVVELSVYNGIPHLLIPVVTDPKKASAALHWGVAEMEDRYRKFAELNVRDLKGYNKKAEALQEKGEQNAPKKLPQIVIIVDELADLMMVCPGEVEESICRLAQLARAAGIHLIIATQRPSVDVITGLIKANMPSRVAFSVSSGVDSRTILDMVGAEKLLGKGDMLFYPQGYAKPARVQGAFVSDNEVSDVVDYLKNQTLGNTYAQEIEEKIKNMGSSSGGASGGSEVDELFEKAGRLIIDKDKASIGMLQRALQIGFNRAARIMDQLCSYGVVGEEEGTKPRKILMSPEQFEQLLEEV